jgi:hypothetical protein
MGITCNIPESRGMSEVCGIFIVKRWAKQRFLLLLSFLFFFTFQIFQSLKVILSTVNTGSRAPNACYRTPALRNYDYFI